jgi:sugar lactone lactonase YvrE
VTADGAVWYDSTAVDDDKSSYLVRIDPHTRAQRAFEPLGLPVRLSLGPDGKSLWYVDWTGSQFSGPRGIVRVDPDPESTAPDTVRVRLTARGKAQLRHAKRVILHVTYRDGNKARTASRTFRPRR